MAEVEFELNLALEPVTNAVYWEWPEPRHQEIIFEIKFWKNFNGTIWTHVKVKRIISSSRNPVLIMIYIFPNFYFSPTWVLSILGQIPNVLSFLRKLILI